MSKTSASTSRITDSLEKTYTAGVTGTVAWTAGTAPSGVESHTYRWIKAGNMVSLRITLKYSVAGATCSTVLIDMPADCPTPVSPTVTIGSENMYFGSGGLAANTSGSPTAPNVKMRKNAGNNGYIISIASTAQSSVMAFASIMYTAL